MPLYEYQCDACENRFERIQKFSDPPIDSCPACGGSVRKLLSSPAIQFKGSGWYITDYAKKKGTSQSEDGKGAKSTTGDSAASGTSATSSSATSSTSDSGSASGTTKSGS